MPHSFASDPGLCDFDSAFVTNNTLVSYSFVLSTVTFPIFCRTKNSFVKKIVTFFIKVSCISKYMMYIYMDVLVYMYRCTYVRMYLYNYLHAYMYVYMYLCIYVCIFTWMFMCALYECIIFSYVCILYVWMYCIYLYIYVSVLII